MELSHALNDGAGETVPMAGKFAAYTPPVLMLLMHPSRHAIAPSGGKPNTGGGTGPDY
ncbi:MAG: hypothetical protein WA970_24225 [Gammaproteobacteria bacterium]